MHSDGGPQVLGRPCWRKQWPQSASSTFSVSKARSSSTCTLVRARGRYVTLLPKLHAGCLCGVRRQTRFKVRQLTRNDACRCARSLPEPGERGPALSSLMSWTVWLLPEEQGLTQVPSPLHVPPVPLFATCLHSLLWLLFIAEGRYTGMPWRACHQHKSEMPCA